MQSRFILEKHSDSSGKYLLLEDKLNDWQDYKMYKRCKSCRLNKTNKNEEKDFWNH